MLKVTIQAADRSQSGQLSAIRQSVGWPTGDVNAIFQAAEVGHQIVYLAQHEQQAVGTITLAFFHIDQQLADGSLNAHLSSLIVVPAFQRGGVGTQLVLYAEMQARTRGYQIITIDVDQNNAAARDLYLELGYRIFKDMVTPGGVLHCMRKAL